MINSLKALTVFALVRPKVCNYGTWPKQRRLKLPSTTFCISDEHKSVFPNQLTAFKKPHQIQSGTKLFEFDGTCQYYSLFDIRPDATIQSIRSSYFRLARKFHPDAFPVERSADADQQFAKLTEAYEVLSDPIRRREYDKFLLKTEKPKNTADVSWKMEILLSNDIVSKLPKNTKWVPKMEATNAVARAPPAAVRAPNANVRAPMHSDTVLRREYAESPMKTEKPKKTADVSLKTVILKSNDKFSRLPKSIKSVRKIEAANTVTSAPNSGARTRFTYAQKSKG